MLQYTRCLWPNGIFDEIGDAAAPFDDWCVVVRENDKTLWIF